MRKFQYGVATLSFPYVQGAAPLVSPCSTLAMNLLNQGWRVMPDALG
jgi:hypothetical protein